MDPSFGSSVSPFGGKEVYSDEPKSIAELDTDRPIDSYDSFSSVRPDTIPESEMTLPPATSYATTYDELRRRNRESYETARPRYRRGGANYLDDVPPSAPVSQPTLPQVDSNFQQQDGSPRGPDDSNLYSRPFSLEPQPRTSRKNQYGDMLER